MPSAPSLTPSLQVPGHPTVKAPVREIAAEPAKSVPTVCTEQYAPVCGQIGSVLKTYSNACFARAAGAKIIASGPCTGGAPAPN
ncbi:MAG: hypothetical protein ACREEB_12765 [Caulobacteraceae bacterium]